MKYVRCGVCIVLVVSISMMTGGKMIVIGGEYLRDRGMAMGAGWFFFEYTYAPFCWLFFYKPQPSDPYCLYFFRVGDGVAVAVFDMLVLLPLLSILLPLPGEQLICIFVRL